MYYLSSCLKVAIAKNSSDVMKNIFNPISIYSWKKKSLLTNRGNKRVMKKINLYFFDVMKNGHIFPSKIFHFQYDHRFLLSKKMGNIRPCKEVRLKMKNHLEIVFPSHFLLNVLIETSNISYLILFLFLMSWSLKIQNILKDIFSITFSNNN